MFEEGFPLYLNKELHTVLSYLSTKTYANISNGYIDTPTNEQMELFDGSEIQFPYRIYFLDEESSYEKLVSKEEQWIYHCIFTRSCNGYVREAHLRAILEEDYPEWCMPYIFKLASEYVVEILDVIYTVMKGKDNSLFQAFCQNNPYLFKCYYNRMISYWNEYYRNQCYKYHDYVGYKLYKECFGYNIHSHS